MLIANIETQDMQVENSMKFTLWDIHKITVYLDWKNCFVLPFLIFISITKMLPWISLQFSQYFKQ